MNQVKTISHITRCLWYLEHSRITDQEIHSHMHYHHCIEHQHGSSTKTRTIANHGYQPATAAVAVAAVAVQAAAATLSCCFSTNQTSSHSNRVRPFGRWLYSRISVGWEPRLGQTPPSPSALSTRVRQDRSK